MIKIVNVNTEHTIANETIIADSFFKRLRGLMFVKSFEEDKALLINPCNMIHTFFMNFPLDILFISKDNEVLEVIENMEKRKISPHIKSAVTVIELPSGTIAKTKTRKGHYIEFFYWLIKIKFKLPKN